MTQAVGADGEFVDSTTPIPMESTSCTDAQLLLVEGEEDGGRSPEDFGTGMKRLPLDNQVIQGIYIYSMCGGRICVVMSVCSEVIVSTFV